MKKIVFILFFVFLGLSRAFTFYSLTVNATVKTNAIHVEQDLILLLDTQADQNDFNAAQMSGSNTILQLANFNSNVKYFFSPIIQNSTKITMERYFSLGVPAGEIIISYDIPLSVLQAVKVSSRVTEYTLNYTSISFTSPSPGQFYIPQSTTFSFTIPPGDYFSSISPPPTIQTSNTVVWTGPLIGFFKISFYNEESLSAEVSNFFTQQGNELNYYIITIVLLVIAGFLVYKLSSD